MSTKADEGKVSFLDLSAELRNRIYSLALITNEDSITLCKDAYVNRVDPPKKHFLSPKILASCKQIHQEATPILYGSNSIMIRQYTYRSHIASIGDSRQYLRNVGFRYCHRQALFKQALTTLKDVEHIQTLTIDGECTHHYGTPQKMAKGLGPFIRHLHKKRAGTEKKQAMDVLQFSVGDMHAMRSQWDAFVKQTRKILEDSLG